MVIDVKNLSKSYDESLLIEDISFRLPPGGIVGIIGANGAGKTTLFNILSGIEKSYEGEVNIGETVSLGYVDQSRDDLNSKKTVWEEISEGKAEVFRDGDNVVIRLAEQGSFVSGKADLQPGFLPLLEKVGKTVASGEGNVKIEGHTDNVPVIENPRFKSNWDLSGARAGSVADYFIQKYSFIK